ncbi:Os01g0199950 [Oryza sativa Japonica Group]|uniref:Os01g0199950 protein n=1 Tax=Oryza sativa subsp. japonica TaxID=39947 RepID=A0A0P0UZW9_ORYSJ|nr:hypothetical protein EE612_000862 [Oryza sativa]BAS70895.1 Os01g0199950 [Oryza sativa Japonica Group]
MLKSYLSPNSGSLEASILTANKPAFSAFPIATVATGIPFGICQINRRESVPCKDEVMMGTPITGTEVNEATIPEPKIPLHLHLQL